jgi:hypothetical protein
LPGSTASFARSGKQCWALRQIPAFIKCAKARRHTNIIRGPPVGDVNVLIQRSVKTLPQQRGGCFSINGLSDNHLRSRNQFWSKRKEAISWGAVIGDTPVLVAKIVASAFVFPAVYFFFFRAVYGQIFADSRLIVPNVASLLTAVTAVVWVWRRNGRRRTEHSNHCHMLGGRYRRD